VRQPGKRAQGRLGEKPQEGYRRQVQCPPPAAWMAQERLTASIATIRIRFGRYAIGLGDAGIRYAAPGIAAAFLSSPLHDPREVVFSFPDLFGFRFS
jgi:hypothetical protein